MMCAMGISRWLAVSCVTLAACENAPSKLDSLATTGSAPYVLIDRGMEPRAELRYELGSQTSAYLVETQLTTRRLGDTGFGTATALPPIRDGFAITLGAPHAGPASLDGVALRALDAVTVGAATAEAGEYITTWRKALVGRQIIAVLDRRGQLVEVTVAGEPDAEGRSPAHDQIVQRLAGTLVPLPAEPIGLGGTWRVHTTLRQGPITVLQTATYALVARSGGLWSIAVKIQRRGDPQTLQVPGVPPGTIELVDLFREFDGTVRIDPHQLLPIGGKLDLISRLHTRTHVRGQPDREEVGDDSGTVEFVVEPMR